MPRQMIQRIIAFEPSPEYRSVIDCLLDEQTDGFEVDCTETFEGFVQALHHGNAPDLVLVSFADLPDGEQSMARLRQAVDAPILAFVHDLEETKSALRSGADYDLPKPFDPEAFTVAVEAVLPRGSPTGPQSALPPG